MKKEPLHEVIDQIKQGHKVLDELQQQQVKIDDEIKNLQKKNNNICKELEHICASVDIDSQQLLLESTHSKYSTKIEQLSEEISDGLSGCADAKMWIAWVEAVEKKLHTENDYLDQQQQSLQKNRSKNITQLQKLKNQEIHMQDIPFATAEQILEQKNNKKQNFIKKTKQAIADARHLREKFIQQKQLLDDKLAQYRLSQE